MSIVSVPAVEVIIAEPSEDEKVNVPPKSTSESVPVVPANVNESFAKTADTDCPLTTVKSIPDAPVVSVKLAAVKIAVSDADVKSET